MMSFSRLDEQLSVASKSDDKRALLFHYFTQVDATEALIALSLFAGWKPKKVIQSAALRMLAVQYVRVEESLYDSCYDACGDHLECISLLIPSSPDAHALSLAELFNRIDSVAADGREEQLISVWNRQVDRDRYLLNRLLTGTYKAPEVFRELAEVIAEIWVCEIAEAELFLLSEIKPDAIGTLKELIGHPTITQLKAVCQPVRELYGSGAQQTDELLVGLLTSGSLCVQIVFSATGVAVWSENNLLLAYSFRWDWLPADIFPVVFEGVTDLAMGKRPIELLEKSKRPVRFELTDILQIGVERQSNRSFTTRWKTVEEYFLSGLTSVVFQKAGLFTCNAQTMDEQIEKACQSFTVLVKHPTRAYTGIAAKKSGNIIAQLIYAESDGRANRYVRLSFALFDSAQKPVTIARCENSLPEHEQAELHAWINANVVEKFGPVKTVKAGLYFQLMFTDVVRSTRHKAGLVLKDAAIIKWIRDGDASVASLSELRRHLRVQD